MTVPASAATKTHLDASSDDPSQARAELAALVDAINEIRSANGAASGFAMLDSDSELPAANLPSDAAFGGTAYTPAQALTDAATIATDCSQSNVFTITLSGNRTLASPSNMNAGATYIWIISQDATGGRTLSYGSAFTWPGGTAPDLSVGANDVDIISAVYDGTKLRAVINKDFS